MSALFRRPDRDDHLNAMADLCICGLAEQERTGHFPEHADWCEVPSPLDPDDGVDRVRMVSLPDTPDIDWS